MIHAARTVLSYRRHSVANFDAASQGGYYGALAVWLAVVGVDDETEAVEIAERIVEADDERREADTDALETDPWQN